MKNKFTSLLCITALSFSFQAKADQTLSFIANSPLDVTKDVTNVSSVAETIYVDLSGIVSSTSIDTINIHDLAANSDVAISSLFAVANISTSGNASVIFADNSLSYKLHVDTYDTSILTSSGNKATIHRGGSDDANSLTVINSTSVTNTNSGNSVTEATIDISGGNVEIYAGHTISAAGNKGAINVTNGSERTTAIANSTGSTISNANAAASESVININGGNTSITNSGSITGAGTSGTIDITNTNSSGSTTIINGSGATISSSNTGLTRAVLNITDGNASVSNFGTISAADSTDYAILLNGSGNLDLTVNLSSSTGINGKVKSFGSNNILKINESSTADSSGTNSLTGSQYNTIVNAFLGTSGLVENSSSWTTQLTGGTLGIGSSEIINTLDVNGGTSNNSGIVNLLTMTSGSSTNSGTVNTLTMNGGTSVNNGTLNNAVSNSGTLTNNANKTIGDLTMSGGTVINNGTITLHNNLMSGGNLTNNNTITNSTLSVTGGNLTNGSTGRIQSVSLSNNSALTNNSSGVITTLSLANTSTVANAGTVTTANLASSGSSTNTGTFTNLALSAGTLTNNTNGVIGGSSAANSTISVTGGTLANAGGTINALTLNGGALTSSSGTVNKMLFTTGTITNNGGTIDNLQFDTGSATRSITANAGTTRLNIVSDTYTYGANTLAGAGTVVKYGAGTLALNSTYTHSGLLNVEAGELKVNGTTSSQVVVQNGGLLTGAGTIGALTVQSGGTLASGNSIDTMNVVGNITLNSGSTDLIEYNNVAMDKTQTTNGNISVAGNAIFSLFNYPAGNFVVSQNILETTNGTRTGTFDSTSTTNSNYIVSTDYTAKAVRATVSRKLNASTLDAPLAIQNSIGRLMNKSLADQLQAYSDSNKEKAAMWVSYNSFNGTRGSLENSTNYSFNGDLRSAGAVKKVGAFDVIGSVFNSQSNANRFDYFGKDQIETNGGSVGIGAGCTGESGNSMYTSLQFGFGVYNSNNKRNVAVNGVNETTTSKSKGNFKQITLGTNFNVPTSETGKFTFSVLVGVQETKNNGFNENGLSYGNLNVSKSRAKNFNYEIGLGYQNEFAKMFMLPSKSSYRVELTGYQSNLYAKDNATATQGNASYLIAARYNQNFTFGTNISATLPITEATSFSGKFTRRENGNFKESIVGAELKHQF